MNLITPRHKADLLSICLNLVLINLLAKVPGFAREAKMPLPQSDKINNMIFQWKFISRHKIYSKLYEQKINTGVSLIARNTVKFYNSFWKIKETKNTSQNFFVNNILRFVVRSESEKI